MTRLTILIAVLSITKIGLSQDFRSGYIITIKRDTLYGLVDYQEGVKAYQVCDFKISKNQNVVTYEPHSIVGYGFEGDKIFQSKEVSINNRTPKVVFLEVIVRGFVSLYRLEDNFFIEKNNNDFQQLNEIKEVYSEGEILMKNTDKHLSTLTLLLDGCPEIKEKIQEIRLDEKELTKLIKNYNKCKGESSTTFKAKKAWTRVVVGISGGANISKLTVDAKQDYDYLAGVYEVSKSPVIGFSFDVLSPRLSERISFHGDIFYLTSNYYNYNLFEYDNSDAIERNYVTIELKQIKIPVGIRYTFRNQSFTPYINIGISNTIHFSSNSSCIQEIESSYYGDVSTREQEALTIKKNQFGLWAGAGLLKSINEKLNAFFELRYEHTNGVSQDSRSEISNYQLLIGIRTK